MKSLIFKNKTTTYEIDAKIEPNNWGDSYSDTLFNFALAHTKNKDVSEDLVQETFLAGLKGSESYQGKSSELTWLVSILKNKIKDYYRSIKRKNYIFHAESVTDNDQEEYDKNSNWNVENAPSDWGNNPEKLMLQKDFNNIFHRCLSELPSNMARVFSLKEIEQKNSSEICKELNISPSNLWVMLYRSRLLLRQSLEANWFSEAKTK